MHVGCELPEPAAQPQTVLVAADGRRSVADHAAEDVVEITPGHVGGVALDTFGRLDGIVNATPK